MFCANLEKGSNPIHEGALVMRRGKYPVPHRLLTLIAPITQGVKNPGVNPRIFESLKRKDHQDLSESRWS
jgi:hypothetical protein